MDILTKVGPKYCEYIWRVESMERISLFALTGFDSAGMGNYKVKHIDYACSDTILQ